MIIFPLITHLDVVSDRHSVTAPILGPSSPPTRGVEVGVNRPA